ncbi:MAG TPA: helix-turn-helix transcriptional regulator [Candidatus Limnocylindrales bacterium]|nr:helix-turn-helix transcriptional regulator [Candidatus Limnocylindrales bacterium]
MDFVRNGRVFRAIRIKLRLRQLDVARRARVSTAVVWRIEHGRLNEVSLPALLRVAETLEIRLDLVARWRGGELDRLLSAGHSAFGESVAALLQEHGWDLRPEVSFSHYGERGVIDLLAWHPPTRTLLVIELKTEIVDVGEVLGTLDRKRRNARRVGADLGWRPETIGVGLLITDTRTNRRRVAAHDRTFRAALPDDTRAFRTWIRSPSRPIGTLAFLPHARVAGLGQRPATPKRVRTPRTAPMEAA